MSQVASPTTAALQWLDTAANPGELGGKAGPLARLAGAGLPVPPGFVITPAAFPEVGANGEATSENAPLDLAPATREQIREAYVELGRRTGAPSPYVAVRSSATAEDLASASFAGQYETLLGVRGAEDVVEAAIRCWRSLWAPHAVQYRESVTARTGIVLPTPAMAVLVQPLIHADAAGVAFTANPLSGDTAAVTINAAWGLGQSIVDGEVEADTWEVDRHSHAVLSQTTGHKPTRTGLGPDAARVAVPDALQHSPSLTPEQVTRVVELALQAEAQIGVPADVEWAVAGDSLWLLQARPITTGVTAQSDGAAGETPAPEAAPAPVEPVGPTAAFPFEWPDATASTLHWTLVSRATRALRPLQEDVAIAFRRSFVNSSGVKGGEKVERVLALHGRLYRAEVPSPFSAANRLARSTAFDRAVTALVDRDTTYLQSVVFPEVDAGNARLAPIEPEQIEPAALADHLEETLRWYERAWSLHWLWGRDDPRRRFGEIYKELTGDAEEGATANLLAYEPNLLTEAVDGLVALARIGQQHDQLKSLLVNASPADALAGLGDVEGGAAFRTALDDLLVRQGLRSGEGYGNDKDEMSPSWREDPSLVIALVSHYVKQDLDAMAALRDSARDRRDARVAELRAKIESPEKLANFDRWLAAARRAQQGFEDHNYKIDSSASALLHLAITATGKRLAAAGSLAKPADVWWLRAHEAALALRGLPETLSWQALVAARKQVDAWQTNLTAPSTLGAPPPPPEKKEGGPEEAKPAAPEKPTPPEDVLIVGQTGSSGIASGRVHLVDRNILVPDVSPGDVLVAKNAGPLWTPVFPTVAAVVLDEGVFFQHAMLTCREYGVPAIFRTKDATTKLVEGQRVTVDATNGWVLPEREQHAANGWVLSERK